MSRSNCCNGSDASLSSFSSVTAPLAASGLFQKPSAPIFSSSSFRRLSLPGKSKRVADGNHPRREGFNGLGEVLVDHVAGTIVATPEDDKARARYLHLRSGMKRRLFNLAAAVSLGMMLE